jgi:hypothetical protein
MAFSTQNLFMTAGKAISVGIIEEAIGEGGNGKKAVMSGLYMGAGSLISDVLGSSNPLAKQSMWGPDARIFSDSVFYAGISALARKEDRSAEEIFRNILVGMGSSLLTATVMAPLGGVAFLINPLGAGPASALNQTVGAPSVPATVPVSRSLSTASY